MLCCRCCQLGMKEAMELGLYLRYRYTNFLPVVYNTDDVLVRSSDVDRTIVSGMMVMNGIFPLHNAPVDLMSINSQVTPVHTMPDDNNFVSNVSCILAAASWRKSLHIQKFMIKPPFK
ncbi:hypothetical protein PR048_017900 [Dryococelus australis]|uniref:2-phosphoxylose phosphatase 1 n=1 Tax=Dryococelus australis TaxID=614101 RepID=A0ABQ9HAX6_9NEOP|nr:hypothetical protein PR048_017900 [Dryococelus australis]